MGNAYLLRLSNSGAVALLGVFNLPPLPPGQVSNRFGSSGTVRGTVGQFTVDATGYSESVIVPQAILPEFDPVNMDVLFTEFDTIGIT